MPSKKKFVPPSSYVGAGSMPSKILDEANGPDLIAAEIEKVSDAARTLLNSRLTEKALLLLLAHESGVSQKQCKAVLLAAVNLRARFVRR